MDLFGKICNRGVAYAQILKSAAVSARFFLKLPESGAAVLLFSSFPAGISRRGSPNAYRNWRTIITLLSFVRGTTHTPPEWITSSLPTTEPSSSSALSFLTVMMRPSKTTSLSTVFSLRCTKTTPHHRNCYPAVMQVSVIHYNTF